MRKFLFHGKRKDNGEWIEGGIAQSYFVENDVCILNECGSIVQVFPETVGQFTGLTDKNGKRIFEGDICSNVGTGEIVAVKWSGVFAGYVWHKPKKENSKLFDFGELYRVSDKFEIIGNIHDNPELLKEQ